MEYDLVMVALTMVAMANMATIKIDQNMYILKFQYVFIGVTIVLCIKYQSLITTLQFPPLGILFLVLGFPSFPLEFSNFVKNGHFFTFFIAYHEIRNGY